MTPYYDDGQCVIYHGDALDVLPKLDAGSADAMVTDPPYSSGGMFRSDRAMDPADKYRGWSQNTDGTSRTPTAEYGTFSGDNRDQWAWMRWVCAWGSDAMRVVKPGGHVFMFSDWRQLPAATDVLQFAGWTWRGILVWDKGVGRPIRGRFRNHLEYVVWGTHGHTEQVDSYPSALISVPTVTANERQHVTQKPAQLLRALLQVVGDTPLTIFDPFMGSGTTLRAAKDLGHKAIGIELDERYCEIAADRLAQQTLDFGGAA